MAWQTHCTNDASCDIYGQITSNGKHAPSVTKRPNGDLPDLKGVESCTASMRTTRGLVNSVVTPVRFGGTSVTSYRRFAE